MTSETLSAWRGVRVWHALLVPRSLHGRLELASCSMRIVNNVQVTQASISLESDRSIMVKPNLSTWAAHANTLCLEYWRSKNRVLRALRRLAGCAHWLGSGVPQTGISHAVTSSQPFASFNICSRHLYLCDKDQDVQPEFVALSGVD